MRPSAGRLDVARVLVGNVRGETLEGNKVLSRKFKTPRKSLGNLDAEAAASLLAAAADVALILDRRGVIRDVAFGSEELSSAIDGHWLGQAWSNTVTIESRSKIESLLHDAASPAEPIRWRQVNHSLPGGESVPILYSAMRVGEEGRVVAVGRDLRTIAALQQKLVDAEQSIERDYSRLRQAEMRYRLLFQLATEAVLIVDAATQKVVETNPAGQQLLGEIGRRLVGRSFPDGFDAASSHEIQMLLAGVRAAGRSEDIRVRLQQSGREFVMSASMFRQENAAFFLVRLAPSGAATGQGVGSRSVVSGVVEAMPDAFVVTTTDGRILSANRAFLDLAELASEEQARNESLDRWFGRPGVDLGVLTANLRQHGSVRLFATTVRGEFGTSTEVEISAVASSSGEQPCYGFVVRNVARRSAAEGTGVRELPRSVEQLTELVGRVSLKDIVRETTDVIERLCIEAALELTGDNRASAAEMLGLSRQSLYVKLRRYGLGDLDSNDD